MNNSLELEEYFKLNILVCPIGNTENSLVQTLINIFNENFSIFTL